MSSVPSTTFFNSNASTASVSILMEKPCPTIVRYISDVTGWNAVVRPSPSFSHPAHTCLLFQARRIAILPTRHRLSSDLSVLLGYASSVEKGRRRSPGRLGHEERRLVDTSDELISNSHDDVHQRSRQRNQDDHIQRAIDRHHRFPPRHGQRTHGLVEHQRSPGQRNRRSQRTSSTSPRTSLSVERTQNSIRCQRWCSAQGIILSLYVRVSTQIFVFLHVLVFIC